MNDITKNFQLYVTQAKTMSVGELSGVEFVFTPTNTESLHCSVGSIDTFRDEFDDQMMRVEVLFVPTFGVPILTLRLRHPSGETGFDSIHVPKQIIESLFEDSYLVTDQPNALWPFSVHVGTEAQDLMRFFVKRGDVPMMVTYLRPDDRLKAFLETKRFSNTDAVENIKLIFESLHLCGAVLVWSWAYGLNPVLLSLDPKAFIDSLRERLKPELLSVHEVISENMLPEW